MTLPNSFLLNTGARIPAVGFGTWQAKPGEVEQAVEIALRAGYRHIDCASIYKNEREVGQGINDSGVARSDIFITGKLWNTKHSPEDVEDALNESLKDLDTEYLDLYLMHWPVYVSPHLFICECLTPKARAFKSGSVRFPIDADGVFQLEDIDPAVTYSAMEQLLKTGKVRAIGVSNFTQKRLEDLLSKTNIVPAVNQIEAHPYLQQPDLLHFCQRKGIQIAAYSPLGNNQTGEPRTVDDPQVAEIAARLEFDIGQLLYSWAVQRGTVVLPKSVTPTRITSNLRVTTIPEAEMSTLNGLERSKRYNWQSRWGYDIFQELGEQEIARIARESGPENLMKFSVQ